MTGRQSYPFAPSPSINIQEYPLSTRSTLPTQNPFPLQSPSTNFRHSPIAFNEFNYPQGLPLLMVQPTNYPYSVPFMNSPLLNDQQPLPCPLTPQPEPIQEHTNENSGTKFLPTVLPGSSSKETESSMVSFLQFFIKCGMFTFGFQGVNMQFASPD